MERRYIRDRSHHGFGWTFIVVGIMLVVGIGYAFFVQSEVYLQPIDSSEDVSDIVLCGESASVEDYSYVFPKYVELWEYLNMDCSRESEFKTRCETEVNELCQGTLTCGSIGICKSTLINRANSVNCNNNNCNLAGEDCSVRHSNPVCECSYNKCVDVFNVRQDIFNNDCDFSCYQDATIDVIGSINAWCSGCASANSPESEVQSPETFEYIFGIR